MSDRERDAGPPKFRAVGNSVVEKSCRCRKSLFQNAELSGRKKLILGKFKRKIKFVSTLSKNCNILLRLNFNLRDDAP